ncbi:hypothetical protein [Phenylobacterium sp.]|jgi:hypothetical protein|uniref:hypothetical protein n=1 Tax=Phenylobacterium sp. TaxID=1871053 RepID=UPI002F92AA89
MRSIATAAVLGFALAIAACSQSEQDKTQAEANAAASDVKTGAVEVGSEMEANLDKAGEELKEITSDPDVKKAGDEAEAALKSLGSAIKDASNEDAPAEKK